MTLSARDLGRAILVGIAAAPILSLVMVPANLSGIAPMPKPPSLAFAGLILGARVPLPVGGVFHVGWVTPWTVVFVAVRGATGPVSHAR